MIETSAPVERQEHGLPIRPLVGYITPEICVPAHLTNGRNLAIYSGGLGVLAGDHVLGLADARITAVAASVLYDFGYFDQVIDPLTGRQKEEFHPVIPEGVDPKEFGLRLLKDQSGNPITVSIPFENRFLNTVAYHLPFDKDQNVNLLLLNTNIDQNKGAGHDENDYKVSHHLYGAADPNEKQTRIRQEILMGVGSVKMFRRLGLNPQVWHLNDAHPAFANIERIEELLGENKNPSFEEIEEARKQVTEKTLWTCHTLKDWAMDNFPQNLVDQHFANNNIVAVQRVNELVTPENQKNSDDKRLFMFHLARNTSSKLNCVSERHAFAAADKWHEDKPDFVTNAVHPRWIDKDTREFIDPDQQKFERYITDPNNQNIESYIAERLEEKTYDEFRDFRNRQRAKLVDFVNNYFGKQLFDPNALTITFARRVADYKRVGTILNDPDRLGALIRNADQPIQIAMAGKSHYHYEGGKQTIADIIQKIKNHPQIKGKFVFIPNYDQLIADRLLFGDVWLNNPRVGEEASGTSGMKNAQRGGIQFSTHDGWMAESGWDSRSELYYKIEDNDEPRILANTIYDMLEGSIIPDFYTSQTGTPSNKWLDTVKGSMIYTLPEYTTARMIGQYHDRYYRPLALNSGR